MIPSTIIITTILEYQYGLENGCWVDPSLGQWCVGLFAEPKNRETATLIAKLGYIIHISGGFLIGDSQNHTFFFFKVIF
jgi:hypothetical protein